MIFLINNYRIHLLMNSCLRTGNGSNNPVTDTVVPTGCAAGTQDSSLPVRSYDNLTAAF